MEKKANKTETEEGLTHILEEQRASYHHQLPFRSFDKLNTKSHYIIFSWPGRPCEIFIYNGEKTQPY